MSSAILAAVCGFLGTYAAAALLLIFRRTRRRGRMPFVARSYRNGELVGESRCIGADIGETVHELAYGAEWDRITVDLR